MKNNIYQSLQRWLRQENYNVEEITSSDIDTFRIHVTSEKWNFEIVQPKNYDYFVIIIVLTTDLEKENVLLKKSTEERQFLFSIIKNTVLCLPNIYFKVFWKNEKFFHLERIQFTSDMLFSEDLTRTSLFQFIGYLKKILVYTIGILYDDQNNHQFKNSNDYKNISTSTNSYL